MVRKGNRFRNELDEIEVLKRDIVKARAKGDFKEVSNLHNRLGILYKENSMFEAALEEHEEEVNITKRYFPKDILGLAVAVRAKGEVYLDMKEDEKALPIIKQYLSLALSVNDQVEEQRAHVTLGRVFLSMALKLSDNSDLSDQRKEYLQKAEMEFLKAKKLIKHSSICSVISSSGISEMKCGVFLNLSLVLETGGRDDESFTYLKKAIEIAEANSFQELLFRSYLNLYEIHTKRKSFRDASNSAQLAAKAARSLKNPALITEAKVLEAKSQFLQSNIENGIRILKKLRKSRKENILIEDEVEPLLKAGIRITRLEEKVHSNCNEKEKMKLYEILGDKYVVLGNYCQAVANYETALKIGKSCNLSDRKKAALLFSLAETLSDLGQYEQSKKYFLQELQLHPTDPSEAFKTQTRLTVLLENAKFSDDEIIQSYEESLSLANKTGSPSKQILALKSYGEFLRKRRRDLEAEKVEQQLSNLRQAFPTAEEEDSQDIINDDDSLSGSSIDLNDLTSDEDDSDDNAKEEIGPNAVIISNKKKFKLNEKGETPLHVAAKKGDLKLVQRLLKQGHEVNPRDSAGWLPIHEAANFGNLEVVKVLLQKGARINDQPAGENCDKITPLHDAASNGHLDVVEYFIKHGANVLLKDSNGNLPIDSLFMCYEASKDRISIAEKSKFTEIVDLIKEKMSAKGRTYEKSDERRARRKAKSLNEENEPQYSVKNKLGNMIPVKVARDDFDPDDGNAAVDFYSRTMRGLRRNQDELEEQITDDDELSSSVIKSAGLIAEDDYIDDDWLEDDLRSRNKRKREIAKDPMSPPPRRRREDKRNDVALLDFQSSSSNYQETISTVQELCSPEHQPESSEEMYTDLAFSEPITVDSVLEESSDEEIVPVKKKNTRKVQAKLYFGKVSETNPKPVTPKTKESPFNQHVSSEKIFRFKICIAGRMYGVPVLQMQMEEKIDWLAAEASKRYFESEGLKPILRLSTKDGVYLSGSDIIRIAIGNEDADLEGEILSFDLPRLPDRFKEAVLKEPSLKIEDLTDTLQSMEICQSSDLLNLKDVNFRNSKLISVICNSVQCQFALREINLQGASLFDEGIKTLASLLSTLPSLAVLNLALNGLSNTGINYLSEGFRKKSAHVSIQRRGLVSLNLSFNSLEDNGTNSLNELLLLLPNLKKLYLVDVDIKSVYFQKTSFVSIISRLNLEELDLRYNDFVLDDLLLSNPEVFADIKCFNGRYRIENK